MGTRNKEYTHIIITMKEYLELIALKDASKT